MNIEEAVADASAGAERYRNLHYKGVDERTERVRISLLADLLHNKINDHDPSVWRCSACTKQATAILAHPSLFGSAT